jgi:phosphoglycolate phosphatase
VKNSKQREMMMKKRLLIFDLDGTIADTLPTIAEAINMCARHFGYPEKSDDEVRAAVGNGVGVLLQKTMPQSAMSDDAQNQKIKESYALCYEQTQAKINSAYSGMAELMRELYSKGYILAVLSNKPDKLVKMIVDNIFPDGIISISMGQSELPKKPDPTVPIMIAEKFGVAPTDTYFIGDSEVDVITGKNAGMITLAVSWGFRDRAVLEEVKPDFLFDTREELLTYFRNITN